MSFPPTSVVGISMLLKFENEINFVTSQIDLNSLNLQSLLYEIRMLPHNQQEPGNRKYL